MELPNSRSKQEFHKNVTSDDGRTVTSRNREKQRSTILKSFQSTLGAIAAIIVVLVVLAGIFYGIVYGHDSIVTKNHEQSPNLSSEFDWGGLGIRIKIDRRELHSSVVTELHSLDELQKEYKDKNCGNLGNARNKVLHPSNGLTYGESCDITKSFIDDYNTKELIVVGKIEIKNKTWNRTLDIPDNLLQLKYKPQDKTRPQIETAHLSNIPHGTKLSARKTMSSDIRFQVTLEDEKQLGTILINDENVQFPILGYDDVAVEHY